MCKIIAILDHITELRLIKNTILDLILDRLDIKPAYFLLVQYNLTILVTFIKYNT